MRQVAMGVVLYLPAERPNQTECSMTTHMKEMPSPETYEEGLHYWPYNALLTKVLKSLMTLHPHGSVLDLMCGPGYLLGKLREVRTDLTLVGVDIDQRYVDYGNKTYPSVDFSQGDVLTWNDDGEKYDTVVCTGALHHIPCEQQEQVVANIASLVAPNGMVIITDPYIADYATETERKLNAAKLGHEYLRHTIKENAPDNVIEWTIDILHNDVLKHEFKTSLEKRLPVLEKYFSNIKTVRTWPARKKDYGEYIHICFVS